MENNNNAVAVVNDNPVVVVDNSAPYSLANVRNQVNLIQQIMRDVMQDGQHYGLIPGCGKKPSLFKSGAEKLSFTFKLRPIIGDKDIVITTLPDGHREYSVHCHILNFNGIEMATGIGSASTMEKKFRYRKNYNTQKQEENPDIADTYNTVLKMAKKRAYVDGILSATAASDIFTQDIEDMEFPAPVARTAPIVQKPAQVAPVTKVEAPAHVEAEVVNTKPMESAGFSVKSVKKVEPKKEEPVTALGNEASGIVSAVFPPKNPKGPTSFALNGEKVYYKSFDKDIIDQLTAAKESETNVTIKYKVTTSGAYTNNIIESVMVDNGPDGEPEEDSEIPF